MFILSTYTFISLPRTPDCVMAEASEAVVGGSPYRYPLWLARALNSANSDAKWDYEGYRTTARIAVFLCKNSSFLY